MHIAEGMLPAGYALAYGAGAAVCVGKGIYNYHREAKRKPMFKQLTGVFTAAIFIISLMPIPVPVTGTCSHPAGTPLAAIFMGPMITTFMSAVGLLIQALFFAHGGLTTLGANTLTMGVFGGLFGWLLFKGCRNINLNLFVSGLVAGLVGDLSVYFGTSIQLTLAIHGTTPIAIVFWTIFGAFLPTQGPLAIIEGLFTGLTLNYLAKVRPDILYNFKIIGYDELVSLSGRLDNEA
jgi:cobalt/nickel transport system permease protein